MLQNMLRSLLPLRNKTIYLEATTSLTQGDTEDLLAYFQIAYPDRWEKFSKNNPHDPAKILVQKTVRALEQEGTLDVLRHGYKVPGVKIDLCSFRPDHGMNPESLARYGANRLRVVPELSYSPHAREGDYNPRLDLALFVNGVPVATLELKSEFKQSVENAKRQYRRDRPVKDPLTRKPAKHSHLWCLRSRPISKAHPSPSSRLANCWYASLPKSCVNTSPMFLLPSSWRVPGQARASLTRGSSSGPPL
ncbi:hypothetical protein H0A65_09720 [Alcaligenaceae bacterium]|nr:hypothetical protein [Alcaligenaceae bacterium]